MRYIVYLSFVFIYRFYAQNHNNPEKLNMPYLVIEFTSIRPSERQLESIKNINSIQPGIIESIYCSNNNILYYHFDLNSIKFSYTEEFLKHYHEVFKYLPFKIYHAPAANEIHEKFHHPEAKIEKIYLK